MSNDSVSTITIPVNGTREYDITIPLVLFITGVVGNVLAFVVLARAMKEHQRTIFYRLVGGLAGTDLVGTLSLSPVSISTFYNNLKWPGGQQLCDYFSFQMIFSGFATMFIVCTMALERYLAICHPYFYNSRAYPLMALWILICVWIVSLVIASFPLLGFGQNRLQHPGNWCFLDYNDDELANQIFAYFYAAIGLGMVVFTIVCNLLAMVVLLRATGVIRHTRTYLMRLSSTHSMNQKRRDQSLQMLIQLFGIVLVFTVCWAPLMIRIIIIQAKLVPKNKDVELLIIRLACLNQVLDPWIYILFRKELVVQVIVFIKKHFCLRPCGRIEQQQSQQDILQCTNASPLPISNPQTA